MILQVNDRWRIMSDQNQWLVQWLYVVEDGKTKGKESWQTKAYFRSADKAAFWLAQRRVRDLPGTYPAADAIEALGAAMGEIVADNKRAMEGVKCITGS